ncbi:MAG: NAD(P)-dependent oxidoreductase [Marivibrio sp.]|uniref:NAD(P)-dependent oxidoreductase n=1 Tax=Marivibrio sp. TaxID=2039719 RepID=UPI0032EF6ADB
MASKQMLRFVSTARHMPEKRDVSIRRRDFDEIYAGWAEQKAEEQASRCSQCGVPFCQVHCPLHNNIPDWLMLTAEGRLREAYEVSSATNTFPEVCGRICPQDRLCEGNCVIEQSGHGTVTIGAVETYITDTAWEEGWVEPVVPAREREESVGIVGAGPGGLAAAERLRRRGYQVTVYDRYDRVGGLMIYGIPNFKLDKEIVTRRTKWLEDSKVSFELGVEIGRDLTFADLRAKHDAVLIATGVYKARAMQAPGVGLKNIFPAMQFLTASNRKGLGDEVPAFEDGTLDADGKKIVVVGGGDTAMDCVRTAVRQGAESVTCLYRRDRANMPGSQREVQNAEEEGVVFRWLSQPEAFHGDDVVTGVQVQKMRLGPADATGRRAPKPVEGESELLEADMVIMALGFDPEELPTLWGEPELPVTRWGTVRIDHTTKMTAMDGVFAAGDIVRGASLVVWAIRDGRDCADAIHKYLTGLEKTAPPEMTPTQKADAPAAAE